MFGVSPGIFAYSGQIALSVDSDGNIALQTSFATNITTGDPSVSIARTKMFTNAPTVNHLEGFAGGFGASASIPLPLPVALLAGGDAVFMESDNKTYHGFCSSVGITAPATPGFEVHGALSYTMPTIIQFNIFDMANTVYDEIERW